MKHYLAPSALLATGWADNVLIRVDSGGRIAALEPDATSVPADCERLAGPVVPGIANLHSHAFQRALAGLTEVRGNPQDSFWTWRERMYGFLARLDPEQVQALARWLYIEMLKSGYTAVAEFHYLHHGPDGTPYGDVAETSERIIAAAGEAGIALTHLPVLYAWSGFGSQPPGPGQRRFLNDAERFGRILDALCTRHRGRPDVRIGLAFHSLRAVDPQLLERGRALIDGFDPTAPVHIHIAEQRKEVEDCLAWSGQRPVEWLLDHTTVDGRWCLVHATHLDEAETRRLAATGAVAGLCLTTEANLGDGIFPADAYLNHPPAPGVFGIGSDSHVEVDPAAELRLLEYGQRLTSGRRTVLASPQQPSTGRRLFQSASHGGARALGLTAGTLAVGWRADLLVLDTEHPALWEKHGDAVLDGWIFGGDRGVVRDVMVGGNWRVREHRHAGEEAAARAFRASLRDLLQSA